eukprot:PhM_4_TR14874/c0_g1_i1/m.30122/K10297/FBXO11; F-box protein 11
MSDERVFTVNSSGGADFRTITEAIRTAAAGDVIIVKMGSYDEKVVLDKEVTLTGDRSCEPADVVITGGLVALSGGSISRLCFTQFVDIRSGNVRMENCDISQGYDGIRVCKEAYPSIVRCQIHAGQQGGDGIYFQEGARGVVEECEIFGNRVNGIQVKGADVVLRRNKIHDCQYGVYFRLGGHGTVEDNVIEKVTTFGVYIIGGSDPVVCNNHVSQCGVHGILVSQGGAGNLRDNTVMGNVRVHRGCAPTLGMNNIQGRLDNENAAAGGASSPNFGGTL